MKETIYLSKDIKKQLDLQAVNEELTSKDLINNLLNNNKKDILDFINTKNDEVRELVKNRETTKTLDIEEKHIEYFKNENIDTRVSVIVAIYLQNK